MSLTYPVSPELAALLQSLKQAGGRPLLVGGCVRDLLMGHPPKDTDIEVFGIRPAKLKEVLARHGQVFAVGVSFAVLKIYLPSGEELDVALPRRESHGGERGAIMTPDPQMTPEEAASRRDFTINALMYDWFSSEVLDFFNGQADLQAGILRHVGPAFADDPLRVLRGMQFAARWNFRLAPATVEFCAGLLPHFPELAKERVWGEWLKLVTKASLPSAGLQVLEQTTWLKAFPALAQLEPSQWQQTLAATDRTLQLCRAQNLATDSQIELMLAAIAGEVANSESFLLEINCPLHYAKVIKPLVKEYQNWQDISPEATAVRHLSRRLAPATIEKLSQLLQAGKKSAQAANWLAMALELGCADKPLTPLLLGRHLEEAALKPGPNFKKLLDAAYEQQLDGLFNTLDGAKEWLKVQLNQKS